MSVRFGVPQAFSCVARVSLAVAALTLSACAATQTPRSTLSDASASSRARLAQQLVARCDAAVAEDHYDRVAQCVAELAALYTPEEYAQAAFPAGLDRAAQYLVRKGSPRGDEGRVMAGLLIARLLHPDDDEAVEHYERLVYWSFDARADMTGPFARFQGLIEAWEEHARLCPTPAVLTTLERLHTERRDALVQLFRSSDERAPAAATAY